VVDRKIPGNHLVSALEKAAESNYEIRYEAEQKANTTSSNDPKVKFAAAWLRKYISLVGDQQPNRFDEIHLEYRTKIEIWKEYHDDCSEIIGENVIEYPTFIRMWQQSFQHVKIREYKAVEEKCQTCALLTGLRNSARSAKERSDLSMLSGWHRTTYMGERSKYYDNKLAAIQNPIKYFSSIGDGMAQSHNRLPHMGSFGSTQCPLFDTHLQV
jgi:hypothetical protein